MPSAIDAVLASIDNVDTLSPDDFSRVIEHWKRRAALVWTGPPVPRLTAPDAPPTPANEASDPLLLHAPPPLPPPIPPQPQSATKIRKPRTARDPTTPTPYTNPQTWSQAARKRLDTKIASLQTSPSPTSAILEATIMKLKYYIIHSLHPNFAETTGAENILGLFLKPDSSFDYGGYLSWIAEGGAEEEAIRRVAQVWFFYKMPEWLEGFCEASRSRGDEGGGEQGRLMRGYDKLIPICKKILNTDYRQYIRNLNSSSRRFRQLCAYVAGPDKAEAFIFWKGDLSFADLKDMVASVAKMEQSQLMLDSVLESYRAGIAGIGVPLNGEFVGMKVDLGNEMLEV